MVGKLYQLNQEQESIRREAELLESKEPIGIARPVCEQVAIQKYSKVRFLCIFFDKTYNTRSSIRKHIKTVHKFENVLDEHFTSCLGQVKADRKDTSINFSKPVKP